MKIKPHNIAKEHVEKKFSAWGVINTKRINDYPEVFEFFITSKEFLEETGEGPIGLGPAIISKRTGRVQQYGSGQFNALMDFLIKEEKHRVIELDNSRIDLDSWYHLNIIEVENQVLFGKYFKALLLNCPFKAHNKGEEVGYREWLWDKEELVQLWENDKVKLPPIQGENILDFIFYNSIYAFCKFSYTEVSASDEENISERIDIFQLLGLSSNRNNEIDYLKTQIENIDKLNWTQISNFDSFIFFNFYAEGGLKLTDDIETSCNNDSLVFNLKNDQVLYFDFLSSIGGNYLSTYLFIEYEEEQISKVILEYSGVKGRSIVIEEIYNYELLIQHFMFLKSKFTYNEGEANYSNDPNWNWHFYYGDKERLEKRLKKLPARFGLDDYESSVFFIYSNVRKKFCKLRIEV